MSRFHLKVKQLPEAEGLPLPAYATAGSAGMDVCAALAVHHPVVITPGGRAKVSTGLQLEIPMGYEGQVRPRSGLALKHGITVLNSPGTIDSDYRGTLEIILCNHGHEAFIISRGDRIAQIVFAAVVTADISIVSELDATERADGGFGSTGTN